MMSLKNKILCNIGQHRYVSVLRTYDIFTTRWKDTGETTYWHVHFLKCKHCGTRKFVTNYDSLIIHPGIDYVKHKWIENNIIPDYVKNPEKYSKSNKQSPSSKEPENSFTKDNKINKLLIKALDTSSENEAENCFKMARKAYQNAKG
jgi:hypothetical protein